MDFTLLKTPKNKRRSQVLSALSLLRQRKGWIRVVEALIAILIIAGIVLIVINQNENKKEDLGALTRSYQIAILREIQLNNSLREEIVGISVPPSIENNSFSAVASLTWNKITEKTPSYIECAAKICAINDPNDPSCLFANSLGKTIYAQSVIISSTLQNYNPRLLKLFCWMK